MENSTNNTKFWLSRMVLAVVLLTVLTVLYFQFNSLQKEQIQEKQRFCEKQKLESFFDCIKRK